MIRINSPQFPRINGDLEAILVRFLEQTFGDVPVDAAAADVVVEEAAAHLVAGLPHRVPKLGTVTCAPAQLVGVMAVRVGEVEHEGHGGVGVGVGVGVGR